MGCGARNDDDDDHFLRCLICYSLQIFKKGMLSLPIQIMEKIWGPSECSMGSKGSAETNRLGTVAI